MLKLESGDFLLLEDGFKLELEHEGYKFLTGPHPLVAIPFRWKQYPSEFTKNLQIRLSARYLQANDLDPRIGFRLGKGVTHLLQIRR